MSLCPSQPPTSPPLHDGEPLPQPPKARLTWQRFTTGNVWYPTWALPGRGGLAVQFVPSKRKGKYDLQILHEPSGYFVIASDSAGATVPYSPGNVRRMEAAIDALLAGADWTSGDLVNADVETRAARIELRDKVIAQCLPAAPAWQAWRLSKRGELSDKWFTSLASARKWAAASEEWHAIGRWTSRQRFQPIFYLGDCARGELPPGMTRFEWRAFGVDRVATPGVPPAALPPAAVLTELDLIHLERFALPNERPPAQYVATGEVDPSTRALLEAGFLVEREDRLDITWRGLLTVSRRELVKHAAYPTTALTLDALREHQRVRRDGPRWMEPLYDFTKRRFEAWRKLLSCLARDREAHDAGAPRFEFVDAQRTSQIVRTKIEREVAEVETYDGHRRRWYTCRVRPVVSWFPYSALTVADEGDLGSTLCEHGAEDWAANAAEKMRARAL